MKIKPTLLKFDWHPELLEFFERWAAAGYPVTRGTSVYGSITIDADTMKASKI